VFSGVCHPQGISAKEKIVIELRNVHLILDTFRLTDINLTINHGEYFVLLGPTGAGKTLLLESVAGLYKINRGGIFIKGRDVSGLPPESRHIGIVYQDYALFPHMTVEDNISYGLKQKGQNFKKIKNSVLNMASFLEIEYLLNRHPDTLSGGEKQRTALARALVVEPEILLLDEPSGALDNQTKKKLHKELRRIHKELGKTVLHITHDLEEAMGLGDRIGVMEQGRLIQVGAPQDVFRKPANQFVAQFFGHDNIFYAHLKNVAGQKKIAIDNVEFYCSGEDLQDWEEGYVLIPSEGIILLSEPAKSSARNVFSGIVEDVEILGDVCRVTLNIGIPIVAKITARSAQEMKIKQGELLYVAFKATSLHFFN
jgi:molybdopterin-binding protein